MPQLHSLQERLVPFQVVLGKRAILVAEYRLAEWALLVGVDVLYALVALKLNQLLELHRLAADYGDVGLVEAHQQKVLAGADRVDLDVAVVEVVVESHLAEAQLAGH
jgi:hypothetical protein